MGNGVSWWYVDEGQLWVLLGVPKEGCLSPRFKPIDLFELGASCSKTSSPGPRLVPRARFVLCSALAEETFKDEFPGELSLSVSDALDNAGCAIHRESRFPFRGISGLL